MRGRCPQCGKGRLYRGYLKLAARCGVCGLDFSPYDQGDGPAFFVMFLAGAIITPFALWLRGLLAAWPMVAFIFMIALLTMALILALLPLAKGVLVALQYRYKAAPGEAGHD